MLLRPCLVLIALLVGAAACRRAGPPPGSPAWWALELQRLDVPDMVVDLDENLMTAGQLSREQFARMEEFGFRSLVCLRPADEDDTGWEEKVAADRGLRFQRLPIRGPEDLTRANAERLGEILAEPGMEVVYCIASDRVGALMALKKHFVDGMPAPQALEFGDAHGLDQHRDATRKVLGLDDE